MSDMVTYSATRLYQIGNAQQLQLSITIGNLNPGSTTVYLGSALLATIAGDLIGLQVAPQRNSLLKCITSVQDQNPHTNLTTVNYELLGGPQPFDQDFEVQVPQHGGHALYAITFALV